MAWYLDAVDRRTLEATKPLSRQRRKEISSEKQYAFIGEEDETKVYRKHAGSTTVRVMQATSVNVNDPKTGKTTRSKITSVLENDADPNFVRRNIITKEPLLRQRPVRYESPPDLVWMALSQAYFWKTEAHEFQVAPFTRGVVVVAAQG